MGIFIQNAEFASKTRTAVIFGSGRSGTSALAGCLRLLGVRMGVGTHPLKHEWSPISYLEGKFDKAATSSAIQKMNEQYELWGWKSPKDFFELDQYLGMLVAPVFLIITRDLLKIGLSASKREYQPLDVGLYESAAVYARIFDRVRFLPFPQFTVSYEYMMQNPGDVCRQLAGILNVKCDSSKVKLVCNFLSADSPDYRSIRNKKTAQKRKIISAKELKEDASVASRKNYNRIVPELLSQIRVMMEDIVLASDVIIANAHSGKKSSNDYRASAELQTIAHAITEFNALTFEAGHPSRIIARLSDSDVPQVVAEKILCSIHQWIGSFPEQVLEGKFDRIYQNLLIARKCHLILIRVRLMLQTILDGIPNE